MADLYLVRHGQTELNVQNILQGWHDSPLTARGREQALATRAAFEARGISFDHAYSSPLGRARHTTELIVGEGRSIELVDDLHQTARCRRNPGAIIRSPLMASRKVSFAHVWSRRCLVLWLGLGTTACWPFPTAQPARSFLSMWPAGENSSTTAPCFILAIVMGRFRSWVGSKRKDPL